MSSITITDPGDYADLAVDAADNAILADYTTDNGGPMYLTYNITGPYYYSNTDVHLINETLFVQANDTSVVVATEKSTVNLTSVTVIKEGYNTWLNEASFFGVNAAINIANGSTAHIDHSNITVHNGAANVFTYGTGTTTYVGNTDLYSSGPISHGLYAAGNGTIYGTDIRQYSGGNRASSFSGDNPGGYLYVTNAVAHTSGIGSATFYTVGESYGTNVVGKTDRAPSLFSDGAQKSVFNNVDFTAGLLAGTVMFSSSARRSGASLTFANSRLTTTTADMPGLWFGNIIATVTIVATEINTLSNILVVANSSQVTQAFDYFAGSEQNSAIEPAEVTVTVSGSNLEGDLVAYDGSFISWTLTDYSEWSGTTRLGDSQGTANISISIDETSIWTLTEDVYLQEYHNGDTNHTNIYSRGFSIYYNPSDAGNDWLQQKTASLSGGGKIKPLSS